VIIVARPPHLEERREASRLEGCSSDRKRLALHSKGHTIGRLAGRVKHVSGATIYILRCSDGSYYTGITRRPVEERVSEHAQELHNGYTFTRRPATAKARICWKHGVWDDRASGVVGV
jgi:GIY-YIG catalytic domain